MITNLTLIRNITQFDSYEVARGVELRKLTLIYAENGRGKTTLSSVFRSLATGDPIPIQERSRLGSPHPPHLVVQTDLGAAPLVFENNSWSQTYARLSIFDDRFVEDNVYSGLEVSANQRQNLHGIILGSRGVTLAQRVDTLTSSITELNTRIRHAAANISPAWRAHLTVDQFCELVRNEHIDAEIADVQRQIAAVAHAPAITNTTPFQRFALPSLELDQVKALLAATIRDVEQAALERVSRHFALIGNQGEQWVADGIGRVFVRPDTPATTYCPFCAQDLSHSDVTPHYRAYFSQEYVNLKRTIADWHTSISSSFSGDSLAAFLQQAQDIQNKIQFWSQFCAVPELGLDLRLIQTVWRQTRDILANALERKRLAPLEPIALSAQDLVTVTQFIQLVASVATTSDTFQASNAAILQVKRNIAGANLPALNSRLTLLSIVRTRFLPEVFPLCDAYLALKSQKAEADEQKTLAQAELDAYRAIAFPRFQTAINRYLQRFNADFDIALQPFNAAGRPSSIYQIRINNTLVSLSGNQGQACFRNTLSAGDRNSLAFAFFLSSLEQEDDFAQKVIVLDDVVTSLDEHRKLVSSEEVRRLVDTVSQVIVLSHNKSFLCNIWNAIHDGDVSALQLVRGAVGSAITPWDPSVDSLTNHDRSFALLSEYRDRNLGDMRQVAQAIRFVLEGYLRAKFPDPFRPGSLLGPFVNIANQRIGQPNELLDRARLTELSALVDYANLFHHETNHNWQTEPINDRALLGFVNRALAFIRS